MLTFAGDIEASHRYGRRKAVERRFAQSHKVYRHYTHFTPTVDQGKPAGAGLKDSKSPAASTEAGMEGPIHHDVFLIYQCRFNCVPRLAQQQKC